MAGTGLEPEPEPEPWLDGVFSEVIVALGVPYPWPWLGLGVVLGLVLGLVLPDPGLRPDGVTGVCARDEEADAGGVGVGVAS